MRLEAKVAGGITVVVGLSLAGAWNCGAQSSGNTASRGEVEAVTGHEQRVTAELLSELKLAHPKTDNLGNVWVEFGSGSPNTLVVTAVDGPGYVVSDITADGFLRVQRLPQSAPHASFDALHFAQPIFVTTRSGKQVAGVFAGVSVHLEPGRRNTPKMNHLDDMYADIGARSAEEVRAAGVDVLDTVTAVKHRPGGLFAEESGKWSLLQLADSIINRSETLNANSGKLTIAFVTQQWLGGRGLDRLLNEVHADRMVYVGRLTRPKTPPPNARTPEGVPLGSGVLVGVADPTAQQTGLAADFAKLAAAPNSQLTLVAATPPRIAGYAAPTPMPKDFVQLGLPVSFPETGAEYANRFDALRLTKLLRHFFGRNSLADDLGGIATPRPEIPAEDRSATVLKQLTETYGPSGHEELLLEKVKELLPEWTRKKIETDLAGNLVLRLGGGKRDAKTASVAFVAHMDEIGYEVKKIEDDGNLQVDSIGGGYPQYFLGHVVLIHTSGGNVGGVLAPPEGWDKSGFEWPLSLSAMEKGQHVYVGTKSKAETEKLGIKVGDWMTVPKEYRPLLGTRASVRSFDDRVGCAALVEAVRALGSEAALAGRDVTFVWSTEEELGLRGAAAFAEQAAKDGRAPDFVFAIDTFVSSDSPLEEKRFGDAELGKGFVVRAVDNSNVVPLESVDRVVKLAHENNIPVQYGVTGGGNDGAVFTRYGSVDVTLAWPLRYAHSPGEVIDTKDADALSKIVEVLAKSW